MASIQALAGGINNRSNNTSNNTRISPAAQHATPAVLVSRSAVVSAGQPLLYALPMPGTSMSVRPMQGLVSPLVQFNHLSHMQALQTRSPLQPSPAGNAMASSMHAVDTSAGHRERRVTPAKRAPAPEPGALRAFQESHLGLQQQQQQPRIVAPIANSHGATTIQQPQLQSRSIKAYTYSQTSQAVSADRHRLLIHKHALVATTTTPATTTPAQASVPSTLLARVHGQGVASTPSPIQHDDTSIRVSNTLIRRSALPTNLAATAPSTADPHSLGANAGHHRRKTRKVAVLAPPPEYREHLLHTSAQAASASRLRSTNIRQASPGAVDLKMDDHPPLRSSATAQASASVAPARPAMRASGASFGPSAAEPLLTKPDPAKVEKLASLLRDQQVQQQRMHTLPRSAAVRSTLSDAHVDQQSSTKRPKTEPSLASKYDYSLDFGENSDPGITANDTIRQQRTSPKKSMAQALASEAQRMAREQEDKRSEELQKYMREKKRRQKLQEAAAQRQKAAKQDKISSELKKIVDLRRKQRETTGTRVAQPGAAAVQPSSTAKSESALPATIPETPSLRTAGGSAEPRAEQPQNSQGQGDAVPMPANLEPVTVASVLAAMASTSTTPPATAPLAIGAVERTPTLDQQVSRTETVTSTLHGVQDATADAATSAASVAIAAPSHGSIAVPTNQMPLPTPIATQQVAQQQTNAPLPDAPLYAARLENLLAQTVSLKERIDIRTHQTRLETLTAGDSFSDDGPMSMSTSMSSILEPEHQPQRLSRPVLPDVLVNDSAGQRPSTTRSSSHSESRVSERQAADSRLETGDDIGVDSLASFSQHSRQRARRDNAAHAIQTFFRRYVGPRVRPAGQTRVSGEPATTAGRRPTVVIPTGDGQPVAATVDTARAGPAAAAAATLSAPVPVGIPAVAADQPANKSAATQHFQRDMDGQEDPLMRLLRSQAAPPVDEYSMINTFVRKMQGHVFDASGSTAGGSLSQAPAVPTLELQDAQPTASPLLAPEPDVRVADQTPVQTAQRSSQLGNIPEDRSASDTSSGFITDRPAASRDASAALPLDRAEIVQNVHLDGSDTSGVVEEDMFYSVGSSLHEVGSHRPLGQVRSVQESISEIAYSDSFEGGDGGVQPGTVPALPSLLPLPTATHATAAPPLLPVPPPRESASNGQARGIEVQTQADADASDSSSSLQHAVHRGRRFVRRTRDTKASLMDDSGAGRLTPNSLSRKFEAEVQLLVAIQDSHVQVVEMEKNRSVAIAQHEAIALAQVLAERQRQHDRELEIATQARLTALAAASAATVLLASSMKPETAAVEADVGTGYAATPGEGHPTGVDAIYTQDDFDSVSSIGIGMQAHHETVDAVLDQGASHPGTADRAPLIDARSLNGDSISEILPQPHLDPTDEIGEEIDESFRTPSREASILEDPDVSIEHLERRERDISTAARSNIALIRQHVNLAKVSPRSSGRPDGSNAESWSAVLERAILNKFKEDQREIERLRQLNRSVAQRHEAEDQQHRRRSAGGQDRGAGKREKQRRQHSPPPKKHQHRGDRGKSPTPATGLSPARKKHSAPLAVDSDYEYDIPDSIGDVSIDGSVSDAIGESIVEESSSGSMSISEDIDLQSGSIRSEPSISELLAQTSDHHDIAHDDYNSDFDDDAALEGMQRGRDSRAASHSDAPTPTPQSVASSSDASIKELHQKLLLAQRAADVSELERKRKVLQDMSNEVKELVLRQKERHELNQEYLIEKNLLSEIMDDILHQSREDRKHESIARATKTPIQGSPVRAASQQVSPSRTPKASAAMLSASTPKAPVSAATAVSAKKSPDQGQAYKYDFDSISEDLAGAQGASLHESIRESIPEQATEGIMGQHAADRRAGKGDSAGSVAESIHDSYRGGSRASDMSIPESILHHDDISSIADAVVDEFADAAVAGSGRASVSPQLKPQAPSAVSRKDDNQETSLSYGYESFESLSKHSSGQLVRLAAGVHHDTLSQESGSLGVVAANQEALALQARIDELKKQIQSRREAVKQLAQRRQELQVVKLRETEARLKQQLEALDTMAVEVEMDIEKTQQLALDVAVLPPDLGVSKSAISLVSSPKVAASTVSVDQPAVLRHDGVAGVAAKPPLSPVVKPSLPAPVAPAPQAVKPAPAAPAVTAHDEIEEAVEYEYDDSFSEFSVKETVDAQPPQSAVTATSVPVAESAPIAATTVAPPASTLPETKTAVSPAVMQPPTKTDAASDIEEDIPFDMDDDHSVSGSHHDIHPSSSRDASPSPQASPAALASTAVASDLNAAKPAVAAVEEVAAAKAETTTPKTIVDVKPASPTPPTAPAAPTAPTASVKDVVSDAISEDLPDELSSISSIGGGYHATPVVDSATKSEPVIQAITANVPSAVDAYDSDSFADVDDTVLRALEPAACPASLPTPVTAEAVAVPVTESAVDAEVKTNPAVDAPSASETKTDKIDVAKPVAVKPDTPDIVDEIIDESIIEDEFEDETSATSAKAAKPVDAAKQVETQTHVEQVAIAPPAQPLVISEHAGDQLPPAEVIVQIETPRQNATPEPLAAVEQTADTAITEHNAQYSDETVDEITALIFADLLASSLAAVQESRPVEGTAGIADAADAVKQDQAAPASDAEVATPAPAVEATPAAEKVQLKTEVPPEPTSWPAMEKSMHQLMAFIPDPPAGASGYTSPPYIPLSILANLQASDPTTLSSQASVVRDMHHVLLEATNEAMDKIFEQHTAYADPLRPYRQRQPLPPRPLSRQTLESRLADLVREWAGYSDTHGENLDALLIRQVKDDERLWSDLDTHEARARRFVEDEIWADLLADTVLAVDRVFAMTSVP
ncbi:hypothetical protein BC831DRAFT_550924 [Entophlyctis helioformis]|nr:hypothetical protein BC831DRAFT_550924 [Entophlyctis helioformis]